MFNNKNKKIIFMTVACILVGLLLRSRLYNAFIGLVFVFGLCFYIQGSFLNMNVGLMNGANVNWSDFTQGMIVRLII